ncbi:MAG: SpoIID/LytB domain-containing protein [candidate division WOR-3 bacterium]
MFLATLFAVSDTSFVEIALFSDRTVSSLVLRVPGGAYFIQAASNNLLINGDTAPEFVVWGPHDKEITLDGGTVVRTYSGKITIRAQHGALLIVNSLRMEEYLAGVIAAEMGQAPFQALKAQAVLSRTLAFERMSRAKGHFADNEDFQVYRGTGPLTEECLDAVRATRNEVIVYGEKRPSMVQVFFHGSCGGHLSRPSQVWGGYDLPYLYYGPDPFCVLDTTQAWRVAFGLDSLSLVFGTTDCPAVLKRDSSGRATQVAVGGVRMKGTEFRKRLGLRSTLITNLECTPDSAIIAGRGYGHGIGLCQRGAMLRAESGDDYMRILEFYYPGARVVGFWETEK